ncbi:MAG: vanadium-dependent haloperoxidase, partial [Deltaproteobacteria bacterium]|nr:vanadium-dependent haloperoxidase [Deltaproteobacteria bacterium]
MIAIVLGVVLAAPLAPDCATTACAPPVSFEAPAEANVTVRWNVFAREHAVGMKSPSFRMFALLSIAQAKAGAAEEAREPGARGGALVDAAIVGASAAALRGSFPQATGAIDKLRAQSLRELSREAALAPKLEEAAQRGAAIAASVLAGAGKSESSHAPSLPTHGTAVWRPLAGEGIDGFQDQFLPPFAPAAVDAGAPADPPAADSPAFKAALAETVRLSQARTADQARDANHWGGKAKGEVTPGLWNGIADEIATRRKLPAHEAAKLLAAMNASVHDAAIACFRAKYKHWLARPTMMSKDVKPLLHVPSFPSYPSAHACLSGAASEALAAAVPEEKAHVDALAQEAAWGRVIAGLHYRFDGESGLALGHKVAAGLLATQKQGGAGLL